MSGVPRDSSGAYLTGFKIGPFLSSIASTAWSWRGDTKLNIEELLRACPVIPVVTLESAEVAADVARALVRGGIRSLEVTLRTPSALRAIEAIARNVPEIHVGAGTVRTLADLRSAACAGAAFAVSPGATAALLDAAHTGGIAYLPAVATASELMLAMDAGYRYVKVFPAAQAGGPRLLQGLGAPFPEARFCPTGGITPRTLRSYLELWNVLSVGGSWLTPPSAVAQRDWKRIEKLARAARAAARKCRK
ncbi:MAG TPA: bifunctional 4-hydroxy-2-oxoglutarate aldolase/2-dehydro-3-deoxy-phosphogluconate aldolase [Steroidobacteraceae bacterium]|nr:bifunctional 4-hydroxy-2-oxoglutarate aldolase/2-dehydro-3-deoxy-phosphogluconate aldolase [Steroidobacteraceae bacterium]